MQIIFGVLSFLKLYLLPWGYQPKCLLGKNRLIIKVLSWC